MSSAEQHECRFRRRLEWSAWIASGAHQERDGRRVEVCCACGRPRVTRSRRAPELVEREARSPIPPPDREPAAIDVAQALRRLVLADRTIGTARGVLGACRRREVTQSAAEAWLDRFLSCGWVRLRWRVRGTRRTLHSIELRDPEAIVEFARPGEKAARHASLSAARAAVANASHPVARDIRELLGAGSAEKIDPRVVRALAAIATHVERGDVLAVRTFSATHLGDSKLLARLRRRLEALIGPLEMLGIRDGAKVTLLGGTGRVDLGDGSVNLRTVAPFTGLSADTLQRVTGIQFPSGGMLVVENLTVFEACCRGEVDVACDSLVVWSAGYPTPSVRRLVDIARIAGVVVRIWADLDLDGVRIARLVACWAGDHALTYRMDPADVEGASVGRPLSARARRVMQNDLERHPHELLSDTVRAIVDRGEWIEQETMLAPA